MSARKGTRFVTPRRLARAGGALLTAAALSGCSARAAPAYALFGAYFPAWMLCAAFGIAGAIAARVVFLTSGWAELVPLQLFVCSALGVALAVLAWLLWFGA